MDHSYWEERFFENNVINQQSPLISREEMKRFVELLRDEQMSLINTGYVIILLK